MEKNCHSSPKEEKIRGTGSQKSNTPKNLDSWLFFSFAALLRDKMILAC